MRVLSVLFLLVALAGLVPAPVARAATLADSVRGRILLDVEENGEAWYVYPNTDERSFLGRPDDAFSVMRTLGLGISDADLAKIPVAGDSSVGDSALRTRLSGMILIQVEQNGEAWYVSPEDRRRWYLGRPADAFALMSSLGLGVSSSNLSLVPVAGASLALPGGDDQSYRAYTLTNARGSFPVRVVTLARDAYVMVTDVAGEMECDTGCAAVTLGDYIAANDGFAAIHGSYFCPPDYSACAGQTYSFLAPVLDSALGTLARQDGLKFFARPMIAETTDGGLKFFHRADDDFGATLLAYEEASGDTLTAAIGNWPALMEDGDVVVDGEPMEAGFLTKGTRGGIGWNGENVFLVVATSASVADLGHVFDSLGATDALNLDGGGSAALYYDGAYKAGPGRLLPNAIVFRRR